jgi:hypothetical protein
MWKGSVIKYSWAEQTVMEFEDLDNSIEFMGLSWWVQEMGNFELLDSIFSDFCE